MECSNSVIKHMVGVLDLLNPLKKTTGNVIEDHLRGAVDFGFNNRYYAKNKEGIEKLVSMIENTGTDIIKDEKIITQAGVIINEMLLGSFGSSSYLREEINKIKFGEITSKKAWLNLFDTQTLQNPFIMLAKAKGKIIRNILEDNDLLLKAFNINSVDNINDIHYLKEAVRTLSLWSNVSKLEKIVKFLGATTLYTGIGLLGGLLLPQGLAAYGFLMFTQILGMPTEIKALKKRGRFEMKGMQKFREKYGILFSVEDSRTKGLALGTGPINKVISQFNKIRKHAFPDVYNTFEVLLDNYRKNLSLNACFSSLPEFAGLDNIDDIIAKIEALPKYEKDKMLSRLGEIAEQFHTRQTSLSEIEGYGKAIMKEGGLPKPIKEVLYFSTSFFGHRGQGHVLNAIKIFKDFRENRGNILGAYLEALEKYGFEDAKHYFDQLVMKSEGVMLFVEKIITAMYLGNLLSREDPDWSVGDILKNGLQFSYGITGLMTTARGREFVHFIGNLFTYSSNGFDTEDVYMAGIKFLEEFMNNISRRYVIPKVTLGTVSSALNSRDIGDTFDYTIKASLMAAAGFIYYYSDDIIKAGYTINVPKTNNQMLSLIMDESMKQEYMKASKDKRLSLLTKNRDLYKESWILYHVPFIRDWKFGQFGNSSKVVEFMDKLYNDEGYKMLLHGIEPKGLSDDYYEYAYNQIAKFAKYENKNYDTKRYTDLRKKYEFTTKEGKQYIDIATQWKEDLFVNEMLQSLKKEDPNELVKRFNEALSTDKKTAIQMLGFLDAMSPGSARELVAQAASNEFKEYIKSYWRKGMTDEDKKNLYKNIRIILGKKYGSTLFVTDKDSYSNLLLFYGRDKYPDYSEYISSPYNNSGDPVKKIKFVNTQGKYEGYTNKMLQNMYLMDTYSRLALAGGDIEANNIKNAFATIWMGSREYDNKADNILYDAAMFNSVIDMFESLDNSSLPTQTSTEIKMGVLSLLGPKLKRYSENKEARKQLGQVFDDTLHRLFGTAKDQKNVEDMIKDSVNNDKLEKHTYGNKTKTSSSSGYYRKYGYYNTGLSSNYYKKYVMTKPIYEAFRAIKKYPFYFSQSYNGYKRYYPKTSGGYEYSYNYGYYKGRQTFFGGMRNYGNIRKKGGGGYDKEKGLQFTQYAGYAVPKGIKKDLSFYEPTDRESPRTFKQYRKRPTLKYDSRKTRRAVNKGGVYNLFSERRARRSSNSRTKRSNTSRSKNKK